MYTYKDILFGLKEEYDKNEEQLKKLNEYVALNRRGKINFYLEKEDTDKLCELHYILKGTHPLLNPLYNGFYNNELGTVYVSKNNNYSGDTKDFKVVDSENFGKVLDSIMDNPFTKNAFNTVVENNEESINIDRNVRIYPDRIITNMRNNHINLTSIYIPKDNLVVFKRNNVKLNYRSLYDFLDMEFPKEQFSEYLQEIIETSDAFKKNAYFYGDVKEEYTKKFTPEVEGKRLVLLKK